jgi:SAM-dependent methyltransferase
MIATDRSEMLDLAKYRFDEPQLRRQLQDALRQTYHKDLSEPFLQTQEGISEINDHVFERYHRTLNHYIPWVTKVYPLKDKEVIELGCGTGSSTAAFAHFVKHVHAYEISETSILAAQARMRIMGIVNVTITQVEPHALLKTITERHPTGASVILLFAVLEHMTIAERLETLGELWKILEPEGILIVAETPNRLTYLDYHTSHLPFFHMLPEDLAVRYYGNSPREGFKTAIDAAMKLGYEHAKETLTRWGTAVSYHEFELALGPDLEELVVADGDCEEMRALYPYSEEEGLLRKYFSTVGLQKPLSFTNHIFNIILRKPRPHALRRTPVGNRPDALSERSDGRAQAEVCGDIREVPAPETQFTPSIYGMLMPLETEYLRTFASKDYSGQGAIVDLGCWFGGSTVALASGLREHADLKLRSALVHAHDLFIWEAWMDSLSTVRGTPLEGKYKPGDSFLEECRRLTAPWKENIKLCPGDLTSIGWSGGPIEFLFVDAMKSWQLANSIIHDFYPSLIPGTSILVQQDFGSFYVYWIHLTTYRFRDYFLPIYDVAYGSSVVFRYVKQIPGHLLKAHYDLSSFSPDEIDAAFDYAKGLVGTVKQAQIAAAKLRCYMEKGDRVRSDQAFLELAVSIDAQYGVLSSERAKLDYLTPENARLLAETQRLQFELDDTQALNRENIQRLVEENDRLLAEISLNRENIQRLVEENDRTKAHLQDIKADLGQTRSDRDLARSRITAMESSKFWKLRHHWFQVKRKLHLPGWETE